MRRLGITFLLVLAAISLKAQDSARRKIDSLTYRQYLTQDYRALLASSKAARKQGIDFYYLNYRTAIAVYALKNYAKAAKYYRKTLAEAPEDPIAREGLYYACLLSGQKEQARIAGRLLSPHAQAVARYRPSVMDFVALSGGYLMNENKPGVKPAPGNMAFLNQYQNMAFGSFGIGFHLSDYAKLKLGYQGHNTKFQRSSDGSLQKEDFLMQPQVIGALEFFTNQNVTFGVAGGYYDIENMDKDSENTKTSRLAFSVQTFLNKRFPFVLPEVALAWSNFGAGSQLQGKASLTYYPLGNLNFYGTTEGAILFNPGTSMQTQCIFSQSLGVKLAKRLWLDGSASVGNHLNYISERSFLVYDTYDPVMATAGLSLSFFFGQTRLSAGYYWQQKKGYAYFTDYFDPYHYNNHILNFILQWDL